MNNNTNIDPSDFIISSALDYEYFEKEDLINIKITDNVEIIGERAFGKCKKLKKVILPENLITIKNGAFSGCESIEEIILPDTLKVIGHRAFANCKRLKRLVIPEGCEKIDWGAFAGCENLEEVVLPNSLKKLSPQLFLNCKKLKRIILPNGVTSLPDEIFKGCHNLDIVLDSKINKLGDKVFENCYSLSKYPTQIVELGVDAFRNCRSLEKVVLNDNIASLATGAFDGCINLKDISSLFGREIKCGDRCFRNCKSLQRIPSFVKKYARRMFENCTGIESITVTDSVIPMACFRGCSNLRTINNQEKIESINAFAFSGCKSLEEFTISRLLDGSIGAEAFSHCKSLRKVINKCPIKRVESRAFYDCTVLEDLNFIGSCEYIAKEAFKYCDNVKKLVIPASLGSFGDFAFASMDSLERIEVENGNKYLMTPDNKILIHTIYQKLMLYANGLKDKSYSLKDYNLEIDALGRSIVRPIDGIGRGAFAGAKNLEELTICGCTNNIESNAFAECERLKKLNIAPITFGTSIYLNARSHGRYYSEGNTKDKLTFDFETIEFLENEEEPAYLNNDALSYFKKVKKIIFPKKGIYSIATGALSNCNIEKLEVPRSISTIYRDSIPEGTRIKFDNGLMFDNFISLETNNEYVENCRLYTLSDGTYYLEQGDKVTKLTQNDIKRSCTHSEEIETNPVLYLDFMDDLFKYDLVIKQFLDGILMAHMSLENRKVFFEHIKKEDEFALEILEKSGLLEQKDYTTLKLLEKNNFLKCVEYIELLRKYNITNPLFCNKILMAFYNVENLEKLLINYEELLKRSLVEGGFLDIKEDASVEKKPIAVEDILENNILEEFIKYMDKYSLNDGFLFNKTFIASAADSLIESFFKYYDANMKRLVKKSKILDDDSTAKENLGDLLKLLKIMGCFEDDPVIRQRASTFITEKLFLKSLPNGNDNPYRIVGDDVHRIFDFPEVREEFDAEFVEFFMANYKRMIEEETGKSGFIQRVYTNFRQISDTSTSDKGHQRKLKVTMDKCYNYLNEIKFDNVGPDENEFAKVIGNWFDDNKVWQLAKTIYKEALMAPGNIFTKVEYDEDGNPIYDYSPANDLREPIRHDFSYEWLPKQEYDNFVLGKYCSCCAHLNGAGAGIMRASIILDCCQNLVIRNSFGKIIAKATLYVNRKEGYAIFNNVEVTLKQRSSEDCANIYEAVIRGAKAFLNAYNKNNEIPIAEILIGAKRNVISDYFDDIKHPMHEVRNCISYGDYWIKDRGGGHYQGDCHESQRLVLRK